jgi:hypothetical protein
VGLLTCVKPIFLTGDQAEIGSSTLEQTNGAGFSGAEDAEHDAFELELWDAVPDAEHDPGTIWDAEHETESDQSSATLSSKMSSKRSISEVELVQNHSDRPPSPTSPGL